MESVGKADFLAAVSLKDDSSACRDLWLSFLPTDFRILPASQPARPLSLLFSSWEISLPSLIGQAQ